MKALLIIGILLLVGGMGLAYAGEQPMTSLSDRGRKAVSFSIVTGFVLIGISSFLYLKKSAN